jgi:hypothetical protein
VVAAVDELAGVDRDAVIAANRPPHDSLFFGLAGTAYACWRVGRTLGEPALVAAATRLAAQGGDSFADAALALGPETCAPSVFYGPLGLAWVRALLTGAPDGFVAAAAAAAPGAAALLDGAAGRLAAAVVLQRQTGDPAAAALADALVAELLAAAPWPVPPSGVAHGVPGVCLALLLSRRPLPPWFFAALDHLGARADGTWCNGAAGLALVQLHAHRATGDARWLARARAAGELVWRRAGGPADLCCGAGGGAYALLALDADDPGAGWRDRAVDLALRAITSEIASPWPHALLRGDAGLLCLAADLLAGGPAPFPCLEA